MARSIKIEYEGGETETLKMRPLGMVAAERQFGSGVSNGHSYEAMLWTAWFLKGKPGSFDEWVGTIDDFEMEGEEAPPLPEAPSPAASPT